jgi:hypothetical protein
MHGTTEFDTAAEDFIKLPTIALILILLTGCSILDPVPGGRTTGAGPTPAQVRLMGSLRDYRLPTRSIPPSQHSDPTVDAAIKSIFSVAESQKLIFDGSRATEGDVIVGRFGATDQMLVGLNLYSSSGRVAFTDVHQWKASDMSEGTRMRQRFLSALK